jgi:hypothetical protein
MNKVIREIAAERERQVSREGWTTAHDDEHADGSLASAAACYADPHPEKRRTTRTDTKDIAGRGEGPMWAQVRRWYIIPRLWPKSWHPCWWKPKDRRRDLIRAAALIVAEIERLDRAQAS